MERGKFLCKSRYYLSIGFLSEDVHYNRAVSFKGWRSGIRIFNAADGKIFRLVLWRFYCGIEFCKKECDSCPA